MNRNLANAAVSSEVQTLDGVRSRMAKADLDSPSQSIAWTDVVRDALMRRFGSLKAAALEMEIDQSQLTRDIESGKLNIERLKKCDASFALKLGQLLIEHAQPLATPKAMFMELVRQRRRIDEQIEQFAEYIAS